MIVTTYGEAQMPGNVNTWPTYLRDEDQKWPVAYNPYIELAATHPIATNGRARRLASRRFSGTRASR